MSEGLASPWHGADDGEPESADLGGGVHMYSKAELESDDGKYRQAVEHLSEQNKHLKPVPGESEYIVRSGTLPDRRLSPPDQRLARFVHTITRRRLGLDPERPPIPPK
jgi:hypothetical protein